ncbi:membrane protein insertion efficiency factor YidD [Thermoproteota archaeon]
MTGIIVLIKLYQKTISKLFPSVCRFYPSCSEYTIQAVQSYGVIKGLFMGFKRVIRCHPFNAGGVDLVPEINRGRN